MKATKFHFHNSTRLQTASLAILAILPLCLLRYFPSTNLVDRAENCYTSLYFYFSSFSMFVQCRISKSVVICSCCYFLFFSPICLFHPTLSYSSFYSLFCFSPVFIHSIFWSPLLLSFQICYPFFSLFLLLCSSASPLCSVPIQSVLFLLVFILLDISI